MKKLLVALCVGAVVLLLSGVSVAKVGDTTHVSVVDKHLWNNFPGTVDAWGAFPPDSGKHYEKVLLRYRLTCPSPSCGQWDYTTKVILRKHTGIVDSVLKNAPNFTVNGNVVDSFGFSYFPTIRTTYNASTMKTDTSKNASVRVFIFQNFVDPWTPIDSETVWPAGYWNYLYDKSGAITDSFYVPDSVYHLRTVPAYWDFERTIDYEIARYITPYGQGFPTNWTYVWTMDVTDYAFMLHDSVELLSTYDGYTQGSLYSLSFDMIEGSPARETYRIDRLYDGYYPYGNTADPISNYVKPVNVYMDPNADIVTFRTFTTGHGNAGPSASAEFLERTHSIWLDGTKRYDQHLWRTDCMFNPVYPQTGTWTLSRAGWCPGDKVDPWDFDLTSFGKKGDSINVDYRFEDYDVSGGGYAIHTQAIYSKGPQYNTDVALMSIEAPTNEGPYRRTNPICSQMAPIIDIRNNGKDPLTSLTVHYGINGATDHSYQWTGSLKYYETAIITLPGIDLGTDTNTFNVSLDSPNGKSDEYTNNNIGVSTYMMPKLYADVISLTLRVDDMSSAGIDNGIRYEVLDANDQVLYSQGGLPDGALVKDTFRLGTGCYRFIIYDESELPQGLYPWFINGAKYGSFLLRDGKKALIWNATSSNNLASFGGREIVPFMVEGASDVAVSELKSPLDFAIYPNPAHERISVDLSKIGEFAGEMRVSVISMLGRELITRTIRGSDLPKLDLDMHFYPAGTYIVRVQYGDAKISKRCILE